MRFEIETDLQNPSESHKKLHQWGVRRFPNNGKIEFLSLLEAE